MTSTTNYWDNIHRVKEAINNADALLVGVGAGMSTAAGFTYSGERFHKYFDDFYKKYGITDMYSGGFYNYESLEEYWAFFSRLTYYNRYDIQVGEPYLQLMKLLEGKNYFVITTNVDHQMQLAGVDKNKFYYMQGDYGLWQCSEPCHQKTYDNKEQVQRMVEEQRDMKIPTHLIPLCPKCGRPMTMNLRIDSTFVQDEGWYAAQKRYTAFVETYKDKPIVLLELGVGFNTPMIIKYPFMRMADDNIDALYVPINVEKQTIPFEIQHNTIPFNDDILKVLNDLLS